jgi:DNA-binding transcriptional LysR family regulator
MKIAFFRTLDAVLRTGSLAGASQEVNLTPSAVSMQMKLLENYFGRPLFDRSGLQVKPTAFAAEVALSMGRALCEIELLRQSENLAVEGQLKVGVIDTMQPALLPLLMGAARTQYPGLDLRPIRGRSAELLESVKAGRIDAAVVAQPERGGTQRLVWQKLFQRELIMIAPPDSKATDAATLFSQHEWIRFDRESNAGRMAARYLRANALRPHGAIELPSMQTVFAMVSAGLGVSIVLPLDACMSAGYPVRIIRLGPGAPSLQISLASRPSDAERRQILALKKLVSQAVISSGMETVASMA